MGKDLKRHRNIHSKTRYQKDYEKEFSWVMEDGTDVHMAVCKLCHKSINIGIMGKAALTSHETNNNTHIQKAAAAAQSSMRNFLTAKKAESCVSVGGTSTQTTTGKFAIFY